MAHSVEGEWDYPEFVLSNVHLDAKNGVVDGGRRTMQLNGGMSSEEDSNTEAIQLHVAMGTDVQHVGISSVMLQ